VAPLGSLVVAVVELVQTELTAQTTLVVVVVQEFPQTLLGLQ
jgi:hypothetical protein